MKKEFNGSGRINSEIWREVIKDQVYGLWSHGRLLSYKYMHALFTLIAFWVEIFFFQAEICGDPVGFFRIPFFDFSDY